MFVCEYVHVCAIPKEARGESSPGAGVRSCPVWVIGTIFMPVGRAVCALNLELCLLKQSLLPCAHQCVSTQACKFNSGSNYQAFLISTSYKAHSTAWHLILWVLPGLAKYPKSA